MLILRILSIDVISYKSKAREFSRALLNCYGGDGRIRTADRGFADLRLNHLATSPYVYIGAEEEIRTLTALRPQRPQRCVSTNSTTSASAVGFPRPAIISKCPITVHTCMTERKIALV